MCWDDGFQFFHGFYWFLSKKLFWGSKKAQHVGFLKCVGTTDSSFLLIVLFFIKKHVLGLKKGSNRAERRWQISSLIILICDCVLTHLSDNLKTDYDCSNCILSMKRWKSLRFKHWPYLEFPPWGRQEMAWGRVPVILGGAGAGLVPASSHQALGFTTTLRWPSLS